VDANFLTCWAYLYISGEEKKKKQKEKNIKN